MHNNLNILLKQDKKLFHTQDLSLLWNIKNRNTLLTTISRYTQRGILHRIYKGFYSVVPVKEINPLELATVALHQYSYLSAESVLVHYGVINQDIHYITFISSASCTFRIKQHHFKVRKLKDEFLFNDTGIHEKNGTKIASLERAVADMLYFAPDYYFDGQNRITWKRVKEIQKNIGYL